jgi:small subunit ribosomal protein S11
MNKKMAEEEIPGIAYIYSTNNNTFVHITDLSGYTIARVSGGMVTKHDRLKANPTVAMFVAKRAAEKAKEFKINALYVRIRGRGGKINPYPGPSARSAVKSLAKEGFKILSVLDVTRFPRGGPKPKGGRRGRRV